MSDESDDSASFTLSGESSQTHTPLVERLKVMPSAPKATTEDSGEFHLSTGSRSASRSQTRNSRPASRISAVRPPRTRTDDASSNHPFSPTVLQEAAVSEPEGELEKPPWLMDDEEGDDLSSFLTPAAPQPAESAPESLLRESPPERSDTLMEPPTAPQAEVTPPAPSPHPDAESDDAGEKLETTPPQESHSELGNVGTAAATAQEAQEPEATSRPHEDGDDDSDASHADEANYSEDDYDENGDGDGADAQMDSHALVNDSPADAPQAPPAASDPARSPSLASGSSERSPRSSRGSSHSRTPATSRSASRSSSRSSARSTTVSSASSVELTDTPHVRPSGAAGEDFGADTWNDPTATGLATDALATDKDDFSEEEEGDEVRIAPAAEASRKRTPPPSSACVVKQKPRQSSLKPKRPAVLTTLLPPEPSPRRSSVVDYEARNAETTKALRLIRISRLLQDEVISEKKQRRLILNCQTTQWNALLETHSTEVASIELKQEICAYVDKQKALRQERDAHLKQLKPVVSEAGTKPPVKTAVQQESPPKPSRSHHAAGSPKVAVASLRQRPHSARTRRPEAAAAELAALEHSAAKSQPFTPSPPRRQSSGVAFNVHEPSKPAAWLSPNRRRKSTVTEISKMRSHEDQHLLFLMAVGRRGGL